jgi:ribosomal-protein-alanine acetyltransferase
MDYVDNLNMQVMEGIVMLEIRKIGEEEAVQIERMEREIFPDPWTERGIKETLAQKNAIIYGAWKEGTLRGYLIVYYVLDEGEIARIAVDASCRRQGIAGHLMLELEDFCEEKGIKKLMLEVRESNETAIEFYKDHGFTEDGLRQNYYTDPTEDAVLMSRELGK